DGHCKDGVRLFYGGKKLYEINYKNRLNIDQFIDEYRKTQVNKGQTKNRNNNNVNDYITIVPIFDESEKNLINKENFDGHYNNNVKYINERNVGELKMMLGIDDKEKVFYTLHELKEYLFSQDLSLLL